MTQEALTYSSRLGVRSAKASIRLDNYVSQRAFAKVGFTTDAQVRSLLLWKPLAFRFVENMPETVHLIPVDALTYCGLWIEGFIEPQLSQQTQRDVIRTAQSRIFDEDRLNTGMFIPDDFKGIIAPDLLTAATNHGQYHRWQYVFK